MFVGYPFDTVKVNNYRCFILFTIASGGRFMLQAISVSVVCMNGPGRRRCSSLALADPFLSFVTPTHKKEMGLATQDLGHRVHLLGGYCIIIIVINFLHCNFILYVNRFHRLCL